MFVKEEDDDGDDASYHGMCQPLFFFYGFLFLLSGAVTPQIKILLQS